jgi:hypothetical protein
MSAATQNYWQVDGLLRASGHGLGTGPSLMRGDGTEIRWNEHNKEKTCRGIDSVGERQKKRNKYNREWRYEKENKKNITKEWKQ